MDESYGEIILGHSTKHDVRGLYKTPEVSYLFEELCKLRFDVEHTTLVRINNLFNLKTTNDDVDDFRKAKEAMKRLGFELFQEYNEYLEFKMMRG